MQSYDLQYLTHEFSTYLGPNPWIGGWSVNGVRQAIEAHDHGQFWGSAAAAVAATQFPPVFGALMQRLGPPLGLARAVRGSRHWDGKGLGEVIRLEIEDLFAEASPTFSVGLLGTIFTSIAMMGVCVLQNVWTPNPDSSRLDVRMKPWPIAATVWDSRRTLYRAMTMEGLVN